jgi:subtilisin family serine protease
VTGAEGAQAIRLQRPDGLRFEKRVMRTILSSFAAALLITVALLSPTPSLADVPVLFEQLADIEPQPGFLPAVLDPEQRIRVIVQLEGDPVGEAAATAAGQARSFSATSWRRHLRDGQADVQTAVRTMKGRVLGSFTDSFNGLTAELSAGQVRTLTGISGVTAVHPVQIVESKTGSGTRYVQAPAAWQGARLTGKDVTIAIVDSGVDYTHALFGGSGDAADFRANDPAVIEPGSFPTRKVVGGYDFVGDRFNASAADPTRRIPRPDPDPLDCGGHGTHVAGIAAGMGVDDQGKPYSGAYDASTLDQAFRVPPGSAPEAKLLAYRVFGCAGTTSTDVVLAALDKALRDGADIVNLSLGTPFGRADDPLAQAVDTLARAGVTVVAAAGNNGPSPYLTESPASASSAISVAALDAPDDPDDGPSWAARFNSGGPRSGDSVLKPDVTAPGVNIVSAAVGTGNGATRLSGTSMATPLTSGLAALIAQAHPEWRPETIKSAIVSTAEAVKIDSYDTRVDGSGVINAWHAVSTTVIAESLPGGGNLSFQMEPGARTYRGTRPFILRNTGREQVTYDLAASFLGEFYGAKISLVPGSVTIPGGATATVRAILRLDPGALAATPDAASTVPAIQGTVTATPRAVTPHHIPLRLAFHLAPVAASETLAFPALPVATTDRPATTLVHLHNAGVHAGTTQVFAWGSADPPDQHIKDRARDIRATGVQTLPGPALGAAADDRSLVFAVNTYGRWSSASAYEFDIAIDTDDDGRPDYIVVGIDLGKAHSGKFNGRFAALTYRADGTLVTAYTAHAPANSGTVLLPTRASALGLVPSRSRISYWAKASSATAEEGSDQTSAALWDPYQPPISTGDHVRLAPGQGERIHLTSEPIAVNAIPVAGWLLVTLDNRQGPAQAATIKRH